MCTGAWCKEVLPALEAAALFRSGLDEARTPRAACQSEVGIRASSPLQLKFSSLFFTYQRRDITFCPQNHTEDQKPKQDADRLQARPAGAGGGQAFFREGPGKEGARR
jgi:hypothetical protein